MPLHFIRTLFVALVIISSFSIEAKMKRNIKLQATPQNTIYVDSIDYRSNLTRVYARIVGKAHTSMKIEEIKGATDIDGIDLKRWFQFEETGIVPIQIDFVKSTPSKDLKFDIITSKGTIACLIKGN